MAKRLSPAAVVALKDALCAVYWYKNDLRQFVFACVTRTRILAAIDWSKLKRDIASDLVDRLVAEGDAGLADLTKLCVSVIELESFAHLERVEDGKKKAAQARVAVEHLRKLVEPHQRQTEASDAAARRQEVEKKRQAATSAVKLKLDELLTHYQKLVTSHDAQRRGYALEKLMYDVFHLFDLDPKASFKSDGEQVDGGFSLDGSDYLFEGKWQAAPVTLGDLDIFRGKLARKLDNTLGLFLSVNGYAEGALGSRSPAREVLLLMDGMDLLAVLEGRISLRDLIVRKRRHAAQTGNSFVSVNNLLG